MKLAEALSLRADLQKRIAQLKPRLTFNARVQEGDTPSEDPAYLLEELNRNSEELEQLIRQINKTNNNTVVDGVSLVDMLARKDVLTLKLSILRDFVMHAAVRTDRYSNAEIKNVSTVNVAEQQREIDALAKELRELDTRLQGLNWATDLIE